MVGATLGDVTRGRDATTSFHWLPLAWAAVWIVVLGVAFFAVSWPYVDMVTVLSEASTRAWPAYVRNALFRDVEFRPLFTLAVKAVYDLVGLRLWFYQVVVLLQFGAVLGLLLWLFDARGIRRAVAAVVAIACVIGLHTSRILFGFWPLNHHSGGLILLLVAVALAVDARTRRWDWVFLPLTFAAPLLLESGVVIAPVLAILWWAQAPGISLRGVSAAGVGLAAYLAIRFTFDTIVGVPTIYTSSGLGFSELNPESLRNVFEHAPWLFWIYNVVATLLTTLFSEPRAGVYLFVASLLRGNTAAWQWFHVLSSVVTTVTVVVTLAVVRPVSGRDRLLIASGLGMVVCGSALGFLYTRDRIALTAGVGYGLLVYVAVASVLERASSQMRRGALAFGLVGILAVFWTIRSSEAYFQLRDTAWDFHLEWTDRFTDLAGSGPPTPLVQALRSAALAAPTPDPRRDPRWTYRLFARRFDPVTNTMRGTPDRGADSVARPPSPPFDIRWSSDVDAAARARLETELGLQDGTRVDRDPSGRTWTYRLRQPSRERVRAILLNHAVEDTARVDAGRFEIER